MRGVVLYRGRTSDLPPLVAEKVALLWALESDRLQLLAELEEIEDRIRRLERQICGRYAAGAVLEVPDMCRCRVLSSSRCRVEPLPLEERCHHR